VSKRDSIAAVVAVVIAAVATSLATGIFDGRSSSPTAGEEPTTAGLENDPMSTDEAAAPGGSSGTEGQPIGDGSAGGGNSDRVAYYSAVADALPDEESFTVLVVAGATRDEVAQVLHVDLAQPVDEDDIWSDDLDTTGWALIDIPGGVLAVEPTGYGDPALGTLRELSADGRAAAVLRGNIQAHDRFGAARDGELLFDDDEYTFIDNPAVVPQELRALFDLAWVDLEADSDSYDGADPTAVSLAMAEVVTGLTLTRADLADVSEAQYFHGPAQVYADSLGE
jgi:hypothetical protein